MLKTCVLGSWFFFSAAALASPILGTWHEVLPAFEIAVSERPVVSALAKPPKLATGHQVATVRWLYSVEPSYQEPLRARLCHTVRCVQIQGMQGYTHYFEGLTAEQPLWFEFQRSAGTSFIKVRDLQVFVQYR